MIDRLVLAVCAVIGGADGGEDIAEYGQAQAEWCSPRLDLPHGMPRHDTCRRVLARLAPEALTPCVLSWTSALSALSGGAIVSIDGKTWRHACDRAPATAAMHLVRAWASAHRLVVGQGKVADTSNAITAIPQRFQRLDLAGATVTIDAMGCQQAMAQVMTDQGADAVLARKNNHATLSDHVTLCLDAAQATACADMPQAYDATVEGAHGRMDTRQYWLTSDIEWCGAQAAWAD